MYSVNVNLLLSFGEFMFNKQSVWNAKLTYTQLIRELFNKFESSLIQSKSALIELEISLIQLESSLYVYNFRAHLFICSAL